MNLIRKLVYFLIAVAMLVLGALFAVQNEATVPLDLLVIALPERSVALWVLLAFATGGVLGMLTSLGVILRLRAALLGARRNLARQQATTGQPVGSAVVPVETQADTDKQDSKDGSA